VNELIVEAAFYRTAWIEARRDSSDKAILAQRSDELWRALSESPHFDKSVETRFAMALSVLNDAVFRVSKQPQLDICLAFAAVIGIEIMERGRDFAVFAPLTKH
jgi:hypothetical protein